MFRHSEAAGTASTRYVRLKNDIHNLKKSSTYKNWPWARILGDLYMRNEFTAVIERDNEWFIAYCPEFPGANGQGKTRDEALASLRDAISLILEDRLEGAPT